MMRHFLERFSRQKAKLSMVFPCFFHRRCHVFVCGCCFNAKDLGDGKDLAVALSVELMMCDAHTATLRLVVSSGRYHLVRRMLAALGS